MKNGARQNTKEKEPKKKNRRRKEKLNRNKSWMSISSNFKV